MDHGVASGPNECWEEPPALNVLPVTETSFCVGHGSCSVEDDAAVFLSVFYCHYFKRSFDSVAVGWWKGVGKRASVLIWTTVAVAVQIRTLVLN